MGAIEIQKEHEYNVKKFCHHCICKTCLIAEVNGTIIGYNGESINIEDGLSLFEEVNNERLNNSR